MTKISLKEFISKYEGESVDVPWANGKYKGECVSLIQQYLYQCYGIEMKPRGNGKDWQNAILNGGLGVTTNYPVRGDIVVWGSNVGGGYGHVTIYLDEELDFDQNQGGDRTAKVRKRHTAEVLAYMHITPLERPKDDNSTPSAKFNVGDEVYITGKLWTNVNAVKEGAINHKGTKTIIDNVYGTGEAFIHVKGNGADGWAKPSQVKHVNDKLETAKKTNRELADEVKLGRWGNGKDRVDRLTAAGYNAKDIQAIVDADKGKIPVPDKPKFKPYNKNLPVGTVLYKDDLKSKFSIPIRAARSVKVVEEKNGFGKFEGGLIGVSHAWFKL